MSQELLEVMTPEPVTIDSNASLEEAARAMREKEIGDILITEDGEFSGIVTDRDLVVRALAEGWNPSEHTLGEIATSEMWCLTADQSVEDAIQMMREHKVRRLPVLDGNRPIGVISLGDLASERDQSSVLGEISSKPSNN